MSKKSKVSQITKMLEAGHPVTAIRRLLGVSESYVYMIKKQIAEAAAKALAEATVVAKEAIAVKAKEEEVDKVLDERESQYGSFMQSSDTAIKIKGAMHNAIARNDLHLYPDQLMSLDMIAVKISRIVNGNPAHRASWIDIAGYAKLVADRLQGKAR